MNKKQLAALALSFACLAQDLHDTPYDTPRPLRKREPTKRRKISDKEKALYKERKQLQEFQVQGETIMAYSKKDAIKRFNHRRGKI